VQKSYKATKWGQRFLIDAQLIDRIISYANLQPNETVLEIGGGTGSLTRGLAKVCEKLVVIERDKKLIKVLSEIEGIEVIQGDALRVAFPPFDKTVSNLPYQISSEVTFKLLGHPFLCGILMYQKEFAERMIAEPGTKDYSRLTVCLSYRCNVEPLERVPNSAFVPRPRVESMIVKLVPTAPRFDLYDEAFFHQFVRALFTQRRKKLKRALIVAAKLLNTETVGKMVAKLPQDCLARRPYELAPEEIASLANDIFELRQ